MVPLTGLSRRAVVAAAALAAAAPTVAAARRRKPAPEAFLAIIVGAVANSAGGFIWTYSAGLQHPATGFTTGLSGETTGVTVTMSQEQTRQQIIAEIRSRVRDSLMDAGHDVPENRIAAVLL